MSFSVRNNQRVVVASPSNPSIYWSQDASGNIFNTNSSQDVQIVGQIIAKNGFGVVDQVIALTNTGEMVWKDVSGTGGLANQIQAFENTTNKSYFLTMVEGSGNRVVYVDLSGLAFNPVTNNLGIGTASPVFNLDVSGTTNFSGQSIISTPLVKIGQNAGFTNQSADCIAIGNRAEQTGQELECVAIGGNAGQTNQGFQSVAIGQGAGAGTQGNTAVAIGYVAGRFSQGTDCVAIGSTSANSGQKFRAVAIGYNAGFSNQGTQSIGIGQSAGYCNQDEESYAIGGGAERILFL